MNTEINEFHEIHYGYNAELAYGYEKHIKVSFVEPPQDDTPETQDLYEDAALWSVFGDLTPKALFIEWTMSDELILHYTVGESVPTETRTFHPRIEAVHVENAVTKPPVPNEVRRRLIAVADASELQDFTTKDIAEWLESFYGYPNDDTGLEACERETFINNESSSNYVVYVPDEGDPHSFDEEDRAYEFFVQVYHRFLKAYGVV